MYNVALGVPINGLNAVLRPRRRPSLSSDDSRMKCICTPRVPLSSRDCSASGILNAANEIITISFCAPCINSRSTAALLRSETDVTCGPVQTTSMLCLAALSSAVVKAHSMPKANVRASRPESRPWISSRNLHSRSRAASLLVSRMMRAGVTSARQVRARSRAAKRSTKSGERLSTNRRMTVAAAGLPASKVRHCGIAHCPDERRSIEETVIPLAARFGHEQATVAGRSVHGTVLQRRGMFGAERVGTAEVRISHRRIEHATARRLFRHRDESSERAFGVRSCSVDQNAGHRVGALLAVVRIDALSQGCGIVATLERQFIDNKVCERMQKNVPAAQPRAFSVASHDRRMQIQHTRIGLHTILPRANTFLGKSQEDSFAARVVRGHPGWAFRAQRDASPLYLYFFSSRVWGIDPSESDEGRRLAKSRRGDDLGDISRESRRYTRILDRKLVAHRRVIRVDEPVPLGRLEIPPFRTFSRVRWIAPALNGAPQVADRRTVESPERRIEL